VAAVLAGRASASVYAVPGDHSLKRNVEVVAAAALSWLTELTGRVTRERRPDRLPRQPIRP
jgi:hypothetical protein